MKERGGGDGKISKGERAKNVMKLDRGKQRGRKRGREEKRGGGKRGRKRERERGRKKRKGEKHFLTSQPIAELSFLPLRLQQFPTQLRDPLL